MAMITIRIAQVLGTLNTDETECNRDEQQSSTSTGGTSSNLVGTAEKRALQSSDPSTPPPLSKTLELNALQKVYEDMGGSQWANAQNWMDGHPCESPVWQGVICAMSRNPDASYSGSVTGLHLRANELMGTLPTELALCTGLNDLRLNDNSISGHLPASLGSLSLQTVELHSNLISGTMDGLLGIETAIIMPGRQSPPPPAQAAPSATTLRDVLLSDNLLSGTIDPRIGSSAQLRSFYANANAISGSAYELAQSGTPHCASARLDVAACDSPRSPH